ncbi:MAG: transmembrane anchor protein [Caulobacterales bacterium 32-69-10]|nr:MAG: transmembrane anchor protein [Caulobacterales bacterium 32-69-10]
MFNAQRPDPSELPSTSKLLKSTGIAAVVASALLVLVVMPSEYGVDPTGAGSLLGLTEMGRIKMQLAEEAKADAAADAAASGESPTVAQPAAPEQAPPAPVAELRPQIAGEPATQAGESWSDTTTVNLAPDAGYEVKLVMNKDATAKFEWFTDGPKVNFDTHGDGAGINYHGYGKGTNVDRQEGELTAAFTGSHGWFWRNRSGQPVTITLRTSGDYTDVKEYD